METVEFPWREQPKLIELPPTDSRSTSKIVQSKLLQVWLPVVILALGIIIYLAFSPAESIAPVAGIQSQNSHALIVTISKIPIPKNQLLLPQHLEEVVIENHPLSKKQLMDRLKKDEVVSLPGQLRAKKDIPPHRPIFWSDLKLGSIPKTNLSPLGQERVPLRILGPQSGTPSK